MVVAGIVMNKDKILIAKRKLEKPLGGKWEFPGGKVEQHEALSSALERELFEEFGHRFRIGQYLGFITHQYPNFSIQLHAFNVSSDFDSLLSTDHDEVLWVSKSELLSYDLAEADVPLVALI